MKYIILTLVLITSFLSLKAQYPDDNPYKVAQPYIKGTIITEDDTIKDCFINEYFLSYQYIDYKTDSDQKETEKMWLKKVTNVIIAEKNYIKVKGIKGGYGTVAKTNQSSQKAGAQYGSSPFSNDTRGIGGMQALVYGNWMVNILVEGKYSLGETLKRPIHKALMKMQKDKYVRPSILHLIKGDKNDGDNYVEILGSAKKKKKLLKSIFEGYPEILKIVDKMDFSKNGYEQKTIDQFIEIVTKFNSSQKD